jgi:hypothetical protein
LTPGIIQGSGRKLIGKSIFFVFVDVGVAEVVDLHEVSDLLRRGQLKLVPDHVGLLRDEPGTNDIVVNNLFGLMRRSLFKSVH